MNRKLRGILTILALFMAAFGAGNGVRAAQTAAGITGTTRQVTTNAAPQLDPTISGDLVVYTDQRNGGVNDDIYFTDLATGVETQVTTADTPQRLHDVSGGRIVYSDLSPPVARVFVYDVASASHTLIAATSDSNPRIDGDIVAFERGYPGADIIAFDLATNTEIVVANTDAVETNPSVSGTRVAYERHATATSPGDIVVYDLATNTETVIAGTAADEPRPDIDGDIVVWNLVSPSGDLDVAIHNLSTGSTQVLARPGDQQWTHVSGRVVAFDDNSAGNRDVMLYDIDGGATIAVATNPGIDFLNDIDGNRVVYASNVLGNFDIWLYEFTVPAADSIAPTITVTTPPDGAVYTLNQTVAADYACEDEAGGSGLASCVGTVAGGSPIDTTSVGTKSFAVDTTDNAGNTASATNSYRVIYDFAGA